MVVFSFLDFSKKSDFDFVVESKKLKRARPLKWVSEKEPKKAVICFFSFYLNKNRSDLSKNIVFDPAG